ncbi:MAG: protein kinase [Isosphaeraceae bacterium]
MGPPTTTVTAWDEAATPAALAAARRYEAAWRASTGRRPDPRAFLDDDLRNQPGAWLALLRADLGLRWDDHENVPLEWYRDEYPELTDEALVALVYEEFCLREEAGETPSLAEYEARFPPLADRLRRVIDIHGLVGSGQSMSMQLPDLPDVPFPEAGQTIAGFHLVEELGRGSFARVFRAEERQLADRSVVVKVSRQGSREPQTLARLQHTHIVPVHSYRTDPATELHLLCMPYLGRVTLAQVLADRAVARARSGAELVAALDRLAPGDAPPCGRAPGRLALAERPFDRAISWWGARLAEALQFAHDRGIMHRDVKPSNVLVTGDGMPMLLDFNLAWEPRLDDPDRAIGGTLAYMAPEHLLALAGETVDVDGRADVYSLGVVLYEAMGARPFPPPDSRARSVGDALTREADRRRAGPPRLRATFPEVSPALEVVIHKCLAADPNDRYPTAAALASDLQAVADGAPLRSVREPFVGRLVRRVRRHRVALAMAAPVLLALAVVASVLVRDEMDRVRRAAESQHWLSMADESCLDDELDQAKVQYDAAARLAVELHQGWRSQLAATLAPAWRSRETDPELWALRGRATARSHVVTRTREARTRADTLHRRIEPLRARLLGPNGGSESNRARVYETLAPFRVLTDPAWTSLPDLALLDDPRRARLLDDVDDLLFLWLIASDGQDDPNTIQGAVVLCDRVQLFSRNLPPWQALRDRWSARLLGREPSPGPDLDPLAELSTRACVQWALLRQVEKRPERGVAWLERATELEPLNSWTQVRLASLRASAGEPLRALEHAGVALALRPDDPEARLVRARALIQLGQADRAWNDLVLAAEQAEDHPYLLARIALASLSCLAVSPGHLVDALSLIQRAGNGWQVDP